jgi:hypothetical protein
MPGIQTWLYAAPPGLICFFGFCYKYVAPLGLEGKSIQTLYLLVDVQQ